MGCWAVGRYVNQNRKADTMVASVSFILTGCWFSDWEEWVRVEIKMEVVVTMAVAADFGGR